MLIHILGRKTMYYSSLMCLCFAAALVHVPKVQMYVRCV